jgi:hypothetical protein
MRVKVFRKLGLILANKKFIPFGGCFMNEKELLKRAVIVMKKHLDDKTAMRETATHISREMYSIIVEFEQRTSKEKK